MPSLSARAVRNLREEGVLGFLGNACGWLRGRTYDRLVNACWNVKGEQTLTVIGVSATFDATTAGAGDVVRARVNREHNQLTELLDSLEPDDVVFDVGASVGTYTCFAMNKLTDGTVVSFEPYPPNVAQLEANARRNGDNVDIREVALSNENGTISFAQPNRNVGSGTGSIVHGGEDGSMEVDQVIGDDLVARGDLPRPTVVKIDVEGAEALVIEGLDETLRDDACRLLFCEIHHPADHRTSVEDFGSTPGELRTRIEELGFSVEEVHSTDLETHLRCKKRLPSSE